MSYDRKFEYVGGGSSKFWRVRIVKVGNPGGSMYASPEWHVVSHWGRIGAQGTETILSTHNTEHGAARAADAACDVKLKKGYGEIGVSPARPVLMANGMLSTKKPTKGVAPLTDEQREKLKGLLEDLDELASE